MCILGLVPDTPTSKELAVLSSGNGLGKLTLKEAWDLEVQIDEAKEIVSQFIDDEIRRLVGLGWTQVKIANECGRSQSAVSYRMRSRGIQPAYQTNRRIEQARNIEFDIPQLDAKKQQTKEKPPPAQYLPDLVHQDAESNLRTQAVIWYEQGRRVQKLLEAGEALTMRSSDNKASLRREADMMIQVARRLKEAIRSAV